MSAHAAGSPVTLAVLGEGRRAARVVRRAPLDWHGIRGLAWTVRLRLDDGREIEAMDLGGGRLTFTDPRYAEASR